MWIKCAETGEDWSELENPRKTPVHYAVLAVERGLVEWFPVVDREASWVISRLAGRQVLEA